MAQLLGAGHDDTPNADTILSHLAEDLLDAMRRNALDKDADKGERISEPFVIATVISAEGVDGAKAIADPDTVHHMLEVLCSWRRLLQNFTPHPLGVSRLRIDNPTPAHVSYRLKRGRAIWFPD